MALGDPDEALVRSRLADTARWLKSQTGDMGWQSK
jgi:hypothetical protein